MILIKNEGFVRDKLIQSCYRFAQYMRVEIKENEDLFTVKASIEDEDKWFNKKEFDADDLHDFINMCEGYRDHDMEIKVPTAGYTYKIDCPSCRRVFMTEKQVEMNKIEMGDKTFLVCLNCAEIMELKA